MNIAALIMVAFYGVSMVLYFVYLIAQRDSFYNAGRYALTGGFLCHSVLLGLQIANCGHLPAFSLAQTLLVSGWALAGVFLALHRKLNLKFFGIYAAPLVLLMVLVALLLPDAPRENAAGLMGQAGSIWLITHIFTIFIGDAALALAGGVGIFYLVQERAIKDKKRGFFYRRLPPLELLDSAGYACLVLGFIMLTVGLITGIIYAGLVWGRFWAWDPKEVWSGITWLVYAALLHERLVVGWRGRRAAIMAIIGFGVLLFTFLGVNFLLEGHHGVFTKI
jgi:cytochrome c-type biogenesis protein CcsB